MTIQVSEHCTAAQRRIIRVYLSFTCNHLPVGKCFKCHVHDVWNIARCGYASFNSFYNTVRPLFNSNRLNRDNATPEFEQEVMCEMAKISCMLNPTAKPKTLARAIWKAYPHGYKNLNSFYHAFYKYFRKA